MLSSFKWPIIAIIFITAVVLFGVLRTKRKLDIRISLLIFVVVLWIGFFSITLSQKIPYPNDVVETVTLTATNEKNENSEGSYIFLSALEVNGSVIKVPVSVNGCWPPIPKDGTDENYYVWAPEGDPLRTWETTDSVSFSLPIGSERKIIVRTCGWSGILTATLPDGESVTIDTYSESDTEQEFYLPTSSSATLSAHSTLQVVGFFSIFFSIILGLFFCVWYITREKSMQKLQNYNFLFQQLVHRDFTQKYKRTILGMFWSILAPLLNLLIMWFVFQNLFGTSTDHYVIYLFAGNLVYGYFSDATGQGMNSLLANASIFTKVNVPKYLFLMSQSSSCFINFMLTLLVFFIFVALEGLSFTIDFLLLIYPIFCLIIFNFGVSMILSALYVFFRDMSYLWGIISQLIMWLSAIFYTIDTYPPFIQRVFYMNPVYIYITYFREIVIENTVPSIEIHILAIVYALIALLVGCYIYKRYNHDFLYYV